MHLKFHLEVRWRVHLPLKWHVKDEEDVSDMQIKEIWRVFGNFLSESM